MDAVQDKLEALAAEVGGNLGYEVDDIELLGSSGRALLRVTLDKPDGIKVSDCESFSRDFSALLDVENPIKGHFTLEVSSPGLDRALKKPGHYMKNIGKLVRVVPREEMAGRNFLLGKLMEADEESIKLSIDGEEVKVPMDEIKRARLEPEI
jgi:ribosome maturation factor RimP